jgi:hypothetical protein
MTGVDDGKWSVRDTLTGTVYHQPNKTIAEKVAEWHGHSEVVPGWPAVAPSPVNEREALIAAINRELDWHWDAVPREHVPSSLEVLGDIADAVHAEGFRLQRPHTDASVEAIARKLWPYLWERDAFEAKLAKLRLFTPEQAAEGAAKKRAEKCALVRSILEAAQEVTDAP